MGFARPPMTGTPIPLAHLSITRTRRRVSAPRVLVLLMAMWASGGEARRSDRPQDYRIARWTTAEGLPQNTINDIVALPNGELWLATFGGLVRFDGTDFHVVDIAGDEGLASNRITALALAGTDAFWFVTQEGHLGRIEDGRARAVITADRPMPDVIGMLAARGQFYAQSVDGAIWTSDGTAPWRVLMRAPGDGTGGFNFLTRSRTGRPWASFGRSVLALTPAGGVAPDTTTRVGLSVAGGIDGELWIGLRDGVAHYVNGRVETLDVRPRLDAAITALLYVSDNEFWVAGDGTVSHLTAQPDGTWHRADLPARPARQTSASDRSRSTARATCGWAPTDVASIGRIGSRPAASATTSGWGPSRHSSPTAMAAPGQQRRVPGVFHVDDAGTVEVILGAGNAGEPSGCENGFAAAPGGDVWIRSRSHLYRVRRARTARQPGCMSRCPTRSAPSSRCLTARFWVASRSGDVRRVNADRVLEQVTLPGPVVSITVAPDGTLWAGGAGEIFHVPGGGRPVERIGAAQGMPRGWVRDILVDR